MKVILTRVMLNLQTFDREHLGLQVKHFTRAKQTAFLFIENSSCVKPLCARTRAYTYTDGKAVIALWNRQSPDSDDKQVNNADTRRNNIYVLKIKSLRKWYALRFIRPE